MGDGAGVGDGAKKVASVGTVISIGDHALGEGFGAGTSINVGNGLGIGEGCALGAGLGLSNSTNQGAGEGSSIGGGLCRMLGRSDCVGIGCRMARIGP